MGQLSVRRDHVRERRDSHPWINRVEAVSAGRLLSSVVNRRVHLPLASRSNEPSRRDALRTSLIALGVAAGSESCGRVSLKAPIELRAAVDQANPLVQLPYFVARHRKLFEAQHLRITEIPWSGPAELRIAGFDRVLTGRAAGRAVTGIAVLCRSPLLLLAARPEGRNVHRSARDLEDETVAVAGEDDPSGLFVNYVAAEDGLQTDGFEMVVKGSIAAAAAALESGEANAAVLDSSSARALASRVPDLELIADTRTVAGLLSTYGVSNYPACCLYADHQWLVNNADAARRAARAFKAAMAWIRAQPAKDIAPALPESYRSSMDASALEALIDETRPLIAFNGEFTPDGVEAVREVLAVSKPEFRDAKIAAESYTNDYLVDDRR